MQRLVLSLTLFAILGLASDERTPALEAPLVPWSSILMRPAQHLGQLQRAFVQFHSLEEHWNPYLTRFTPTQYLGVRAWADEQRPWLREDYESPAVRFFVSRNSESEAVLRTALPHQRYELLLIPREQCAGAVWSEVIALRRLTKEVPQASVRHAARAIQLMEREAWDLATSELDRALAAPLPAAARSDLLELESQIPRAALLAARAQSRQREFALGGRAAEAASQSESWADPLPLAARD